MRELKKFLFLIGFLVVAGSAGACDLDTITLTQGAIQGVAGLAMMAIGTM